MMLVQVKSQMLKIVFRKLQLEEVRVDITLANSIDGKLHSKIGCYTVSVYHK